MTPQALIGHTPIANIYRSKVCERLLVIDKMQSGSGKADALNTGISYARKDFVCVVDADSMLENDSLQKIMAPFEKDSRTVAVGGAIRCGNVDPMVFNPLVRAQKVEYSRIFFMDRVVLSNST